MKISHHAVVSLVVSALVWLWLRSAAAALACFLAGVFVDVDHLLDYVWRHGARIRPRHLFRVFETEVFDNIFIFLHAWEWILVALVILWLLDWQPVMVGLAIGFSVHLALDQLVNRHSPWSYFLTYRAWHRFSGPRYYGAREYRRRLQQLKKPAGGQIRPRGGSVTPVAAIGNR
jgi:hypothetical protein